MRLPIVMVQNPALWIAKNINETSEKLLFPNFLDGPWFNGLLKERRRRRLRIGRCSPASGPRVPQIPNSPQARSRRRSCYTAGTAGMFRLPVHQHWYLWTCVGTMYVCADVRPRLIAKLDARYPTPAGLCRRANRSYQSKSYRPDVWK